MSDKITRYEADPSYGCPKIIESEEGEFVMFSDYQKEAARIDWIEKHKALVQPWGLNPPGSRWQIRTIKGHWFGPTIREVVDFAMKEQP